jgi:hypothetical protein
VPGNGPDTTGLVSPTILRDETRAKAGLPPSALWMQANP